MALPAHPPSIAFKEPLYKPNTEPTFASLSPVMSTTSQRRGSLGAPDAHESFAQDWTTTTAPQDTWAARERRRSSMWAKVDGYPGGSHMNRPRTISGGSTGSSGLALTKSISHTSSGSSAAGGSPSKKKGSILSVFHDDDDEDIDTLKMRRSSRDDGTLDPPKERRGSVLSLFRRSKDEKGRNIINSDGQGRPPARVV